MKHLVIAAVIVVAMACGGPEGPQGDRGPEGPKGEQGNPGPTGDAGTPGGGFYTSKQNVYCKEAIGTTDAAGYGIAVDCNDANDLYLTGSCDRVSAANSFLYQNEAVGLDKDSSASFPAGHRCGWVFNPGGGAPTSLPTARARLCCIEVP